MAAEATISVSLSITKGNLQYQNGGRGYNADVTGSFGPTPGCISVSTDGTDVNLSELTVPGLCHLRNLDTINFVEYGIWEPATSTFYPLGCILPGESFILRLSPNLREQYAGTGTGTTGPENSFRFKADTAACNVLVEIFEK